jgi:carboxyl-terminal processing protease
MRAPHAGVLLATALLAACGGSDDGGTTTEPPPTPTNTISLAARNYLTQGLDWEQEVSYYAKQINWTQMRADVIAHAGAAQRPADVYDDLDYSIDRYLRPLGDTHSFFFPPSEAPGRTDNPPNDIRYSNAGSMITSNVAYLNVPSFIGRNPVGHADSTVAEVKRLDALAPCGWILDLRANYGGSIGSMMAGLSSLIQQGTHGGMVDANNAQALFYLEGPEWGFIDVSDNNKKYVDTRGTTTYALKRPAAPVALLQGPYTASAGELIVMAYKGSSVPSRTFGSPTNGLTTSPLGIYLRPDSGFLNITYAVWFDRTGKRYGSSIAPDSLIPQSRTFAEYSNIIGKRDAAVDAAVTWLQARPECKAGAGLAPVAARAQRLPASGIDDVVLPAPPSPRTRPFQKPNFVRARGVHPTS